MRPSSLDNSFETRHRTRRPFVVTTTGIKSIAICQQSSAGTPPTTAADHEPARASKMVEPADPTQRRLEGRHARAHVAAIERQTNGRSDRHTKAFAQSPAHSLRGSRIRALPRGERSPRIHMRSTSTPTVRRSKLAVSAKRRAGLDRTGRTDQNLVRRMKGGVENDCSKDLQTEGLSRQPTLRPSVVVRCDARRQAVAHACK